MHAMTIMRDKKDKKGGILKISIKRFTADKHFCSTHTDASEIDYWTVSVKDNGVGMGEKTVEKIFNPFFTTKEVGVGTGLGLSMVYNIVKSHAGVVDVYSEIGIGTIFSLYFPAVDGEKKEESDAEVVNIPMGTGLILVVDDEEIIRVISKEILEECGYEAVLADGGMSALSIYEKMYDKIDLILLDYNMPEMSGKDVFRSMKQINPNLKVIFGSGFFNDERLKELEEIGAVGYIQKPYTISSLAEKIKSVQ